MRDVHPRPQEGVFRCDFNKIKAEFNEEVKKHWVAAEFLEKEFSALFDVYLDALFNLPNYARKMLLDGMPKETLVRKATKKVIEKLEEIESKGRKALPVD